MCEFPIANLCGCADEKIDKQKVRNRVNLIKEYIKYLNERGKHEPKK